MLGLEGSVQLPTFGKVAPYRSADGQVEVDALAEACAEPGRSAEGGELWAVEIKWRGKMAGVKELQRLASAAKALSARPWFISKAGFTPEAEDYARREGIMFSTREQVERLARIISEE